MTTNMIFGNKSKQIKKPSVFRLISEAGWAVMELGAFKLTKPLLRRLGTGDGHPVLILPGFMASDFSTSPLRHLLNEIGYTAYGWEMGRNYGSPQYILYGVRKLEKIFAENGNKRVSIIGWSLGGVYAREIAKERPDLVRQVITLGSPFAGLVKPNNAAWLYNIVSGGKKVKDIPSEFLEGLPEPPPVPTTAIYTKGDGVVSWQYCLEQEEGPQRQNIQVKGSHCGLGHNPVVLSIILDRLAFKKQEWRRYQWPWMKKNKNVNVNFA